MTNHKPATALPWRVAENKYGKRAIVSVPAQKAAGEKANMWTGRIFVCPKSAKRAQDALFAMHSANAYPKLVAVLQTALAVEQSHGQDSQPWAEDARALLHQLGEG